MIENRKYVINVNFRTTSVIHLNSKLFSVDARCVIRERKKKIGGWIEYSEQEIRDFLENKKPLLFNGKKVINLTTCNLCSRLDGYISTFRNSKKIQVSESEFIENYKILTKFLDNVKIDIHKIVNNLHYLLPLDSKLQESFKANLWIFDRSIDQGIEEIPKKQYQQQLIDHGFYSPEIERKMQLYYDSRDYEFTQDMEEIKPEKSSKLSRILGWVGRNLNIINVILGSLSSIFPALGAATEYKETIEHTINYSFA